MATQLEQNIKASFGFVKKDLLMVNDAISDIHEKIQHLSLNHASLLGQLTRLAERIEKIESKGKKNTGKQVKTVKNKVMKKTLTKSKPVKKKVIKETVTYS